MKVWAAITRPTLCSYLANTGWYRNSRTDSCTAAQTCFPLPQPDPGLWRPLSSANFSWIMMIFGIVCQNNCTQNNAYYLHSFMKKNWQERLKLSVKCINSIIAPSIVPRELTKAINETILICPCREIKWVMKLLGSYLALEERDSSPRVPHSPFLVAVVGCVEDEVSRPLLLTDPFSPERPLVLLPLRGRVLK